MPHSEIVVTNVKRKEIRDLLVEDKRVDGRKLTEYRPITTETGMIGKAEGSALVSIGNTKVMVGVKVEIGTPFSDKPEDGALAVIAELVPLASPKFEPGPPNENAVELARVVDRGLRESKALDLSRLCLVPGKKVLVVFIDIYVLDHDGNLFDASALAAILALLNTKMKKYIVKNEEIIIKDEKIRLPLQNFPVEISIGKIANKIFCDPSLEEEEIADTLITIAVKKNGEICAVQKRKTGPLSVNEILQAISIARNKADEMRKDVIGEAIDDWEKG